MYWLLAAGLACQHARAGCFALHPAWMICSVAMTWVNVTLRLFLPWMLPRYGDFVTFAIVAWAYWLPNMIVAAWIIRRNAAARAITTA